jgi:hypothetical protein
MYPEESKESLMRIKGQTFRDCIPGSTYVIEAKEAERGAKGAFFEGAEEEEDEEVELTVKGDEDPSLSPIHPKNKKYVHEVIVHPENSSTKDFLDLSTPKSLAWMFDK